MVLILDWCLISHPSVGVPVHGEPREDFWDNYHLIVLGTQQLKSWYLKWQCLFSDCFLSTSTFQIKKKKYAPGNFNLIFDNVLISEVKQTIKHANSTRTYLKVIKTYIMEDWTSNNTWTNCNHCCTVSSVSLVLFLVCLSFPTVILALISPSIWQSEVPWGFLIDSSLSCSSLSLLAET